jgi:hypothetical protein
VDARAADRRDGRILGGSCDGTAIVRALSIKDSRKKQARPAKEEAIFKMPETRRGLSDAVPIRPGCQEGL